MLTVVDGVVVTMSRRSGLLAAETTNAALGWTAIGILVAAAVALGLAGELLWSVMALAAAAVGVLPPAVSRRSTELPAWELLALAAVPVVARSLGVVVGPLAYVAVAALALLVAAELDAFTAVEMTPSFAVAFVVVVTMAAAGLWTVARYAADAALGTSWLGDQNAVMWDLVAATGVGVVAGVVFEWYVRRRSPGHDVAREPRGAAP